MRARWRVLAAFTVAMTVVGTTSADAAEQPAADRPATLGIILTYHKPEPDGGGWLVVRRVIPASPGEKAGLRVGDMITAIDGKALLYKDNRSLVLGMAEALRAGKKATLRVLRNDRPCDLVAIPVRMSDAQFEQWKTILASLSGGPSAPRPKQ